MADFRRRTDKMISHDYDLGDWQAFTTKNVASAAALHRAWAIWRRFSFRCFFHYQLTARQLVAGWYLKNVGSYAAKFRRCLSTTKDHEATNNAIKYTYALDSQFYRYAVHYLIDEPFMLVLNSYGLLCKVGRLYGMNFILSMFWTVKFWATVAIKNVTKMQCSLDINIIEYLTYLYYHVRLLLKGDVSFLDL